MHRQAGHGVDGTVGSERGVGQPGLGVERHQQLPRSDEDPLLDPVAPVGDASVGAAPDHVPETRGVRVVPPQLGAARGIERHGLAQR